MTVSVCIPYFDNAPTIRRVLASIRDQTRPPEEIVLVNDGSLDRDVHELGERVVDLPGNSGRGAARAAGMKATRGDFVVFIDANKTVRPDFIALALQWFEQEEIGAVFGCVTQPPAQGMIERWRGRHLFRENGVTQPLFDVTFITGACCIRRSASEMVGGFNHTLVDAEDEDFGQRLKRMNFQVVCDPALNCLSISRNSVGAVLERFGRWNTRDPLTLRQYLQQISYSIKVMAREDMRAGDPLAACISLASPHYQFWRLR